MAKQFGEIYGYWIRVAVAGGTVWVPSNDAELRNHIEMLKTAMTNRSDGTPGYIVQFNVVREGVHHGLATVGIWNGAIAGWSVEKMPDETLQERMAKAVEKQVSLQEKAMEDGEDWRDK